MPGYPAGTLANSPARGRSGRLRPWKVVCGFTREAAGSRFWYCCTALARPGVFAVGAPDMAQLLARSQAPVTLARGERDPMNTDEQLARLGAPTATLPGLGHNAHVESPELSITLLDPHR